MPQREYPEWMGKMRGLTPSEINEFQAIPGYGLARVGWPGIVLYSTREGRIRTLHPGEPVPGYLVCARPGALHPRTVRGSGGDSRGPQVDGGFDVRDGPAYGGALPGRTRAGISGAISLSSALPGQVYPREDYLLGRRGVAFQVSIRDKKQQILGRY